MVYLTRIFGYSWILILLLIFVYTRHVYEWNFFLKSGYYVYKLLCISLYIIRLYYACKLWIFRRKTKSNVYRILYGGQVTMNDGDELKKNNNKRRRRTSSTFTTHTSWRVLHCRETRIKCAHDTYCALNTFNNKHRPKIDGQQIRMRLDDLLGETRRRAAIGRRKIARRRMDGTRARVCGAKRWKKNRPPLDKSESLLVYNSWYTRSTYAGPGGFQ